jgi:2-polyprenyl-3-methyl-5-hydroxy-6-metoxy-1,4-benzoquinol methylase
MSFNYQGYWTDRTSVYNTLKPEWRKAITDIVGNKSVLDIGCGSGRFAPCFDPKKYLGIDINITNIHAARDLNFGYTFEQKDIVTWEPDKVYDYIITWTTLELIPNEHINGVVSKIKKYGKNILLAEPYGTKSEVPYCFDYDYEQLFDVIKKEPIDAGVYLYQAKGGK